MVFSTFWQRPMKSIKPCIQSEKHSSACSFSAEAINRWISILLNENHGPRGLLVPPPTPLSSFVSASGTLVIVFVCIIVFSVVLSLTIVAATFIICEFVFWLMIERHQGDVEEGQRLHTTSPDSVSHHTLHRDEMYQASDQNNLRVLAMLERIIRVIEGGTEQKEHKRLQQPKSYGIHETESRFRGECSICFGGICNRGSVSGVSSVQPRLPFELHQRVG